MSLYDYPVFEPKKQGRLTILICTPDQRSPRFTRCLDSVYKTTRGIPCSVMVLDNRGDSKFSHAREINRALSISQAPLITLDDDVTVTGPWLEAMLEAVNSNVGVVACSVWRNPELLWSRALTFDQTGKVRNWKGDITHATPVPAACSCCWLINTQAGVTACASGSGSAFDRLSLTYSKYYFDPDFCFRLWTKGLQTVVIPEPVYHEGAGVTRELCADMRGVLDAEREAFRRTWITSGWLQELRDRYAPLWPEDLRW